MACLACRGHSEKAGRGQVKAQSLPAVPEDRLQGPLAFLGVLVLQQALQDPRILGHPKRQSQMPIISTSGKSLLGFPSGPQLRVGLYLLAFGSHHADLPRPALDRNREWRLSERLCGPAGRQLSKSLTLHGAGSGALFLLPPSSPLP